MGQAFGDTDTQITKNVREISPNKNVIIQRARNLFLTNNLDDIWQHEFSESAIKKTKRLAQKAGHSIKTLFFSYWVIRQE